MGEFVSDGEYFFVEYSDFQLNVRAYVDSVGALIANMLQKIEDATYNRGTQATASHIRTIGERYIYHIMDDIEGGKMDAKLSSITVDGLASPSKEWRMAISLLIEEDLTAVTQELIEDINAERETAFGGAYDRNTM